MGSGAFHYYPEEVDPYHGDLGLAEELLEVAKINIGFNIIN